MQNSCSCIAIVAKQSEVAGAIELLYRLDIDTTQITVINKQSQQKRVDTLLLSSSVPEGSRYCYQCMIDAGLKLLVIQGSPTLVENAAALLETLHDIDISIHLDIPQNSTEKR